VRQYSCEGGQFGERTVWKVESGAWWDSGEGGQWGGRTVGWGGTVERVGQ